MQFVKKPRFPCRRSPRIEQFDGDEELREGGTTKR
jgi:hypothetical protein